MDPVDAVLIFLDFMDVDFDVGYDEDKDHLRLPLFSGDPPPILKFSHKV